MAAYSQDLRQRVLDAVEREEGSLRQIARRFVVSLSFVVRLLQLHRRTGSIDPKPPAAATPPRWGRTTWSDSRSWFASSPTPRSRNCASGSASRVASRPSGAPWRSCGCRARRRSFAPPSRTRPEVQEKRRDFCDELAGVDPQRLVFIDESAANTSMTRTYGRAPVGERVYASAPGHWDTITLTCGLRLSGVTAAMAFEGATNTGTFENYVEQVLVPELRPGDVVIWDNPKPHQSEEAIEAVERAGARVLPLPPWSPDLTPIEEMFSKVKEALRSAGPRTKAAVYKALVMALHEVTPEDIAGWFQDRAAYAMQP